LLPAKSIFGPLEGHLVGCEYDTRRLIRMSLDKVNGEYQGCCYPLSIPPADIEKGLLGPIVCAIKPTTGELYVGEIRDSGWGASNNIGQIVKIKIEPEKLPCGIAEVKANKTGFTIDFFQPVDKTKAADLASYSIESYRRENYRLHGTIAELSGNAELAAMVRQVWLPGQMVELRGALDIDYYRQSARDHRRIVEAILARDSAGAEAAMRAHLEAGCEVILSLPSRVFGS